MPVIQNAEIFLLVNSKTHHQNNYIKYFDEELKTFKVKTKSTACKRDIICWPVIWPLACDILQLIHLCDA